MTTACSHDKTGMAPGAICMLCFQESVDAHRRLDALRWQIENEGCAASHLGETTYECRADAPCGLCRLRSERDKLRAVLDEACRAEGPHEYCRFCRGEP